MAEESGVDVRLADVLRALSAELERAGAGSGSGVRADAVTVELDVAVEAGDGGQVSFWVGKVGGTTKRARTTRLSVTLSGPDRAGAGGAPTPPAGVDVRGTAGPEPEAPEAAAEPRPLGLVDVLAEALKTIADTAGRSTGPSWPPRPGGPGAGGSRPDGGRNPAD